MSAVEHTNHCECVEDQSEMLSIVYMQAQADANDRWRKRLAAVEKLVDVWKPAGGVFKLCAMQLEDALKEGL